MAKVLKVIKKPRSSPIPDLPINFKPLKNLHLELLEIKDKLKAGLPLIPLAKVKLKPEYHEESNPSKGGGVIESSSSVSILEEKKDKHKKRHDKSSKKHKKKDKHHKKHKEPDELELELGEEDEELEEEELLGESADQGTSGEEEPTEGKEEEFDIYAGLTPEERAAKEKEEYIWRFRILKKKWGNNASIPIPDYNEFSDLNMMKTSYERTIRELYLDDAVETYRSYLMGSWIVMEYFCTQHMDIDLVGFAEYQMKIMYKYDRMLIELGEKSYTRWGSNIPVEVRLIAMILFQAAIFYLGKIIAEKMGKNVAELFRGVTGQPPAEPTRPQERPTPKEDEPKKKMKGPSINADDIRKNQ